MYDLSKPQGESCYRLLSRTGNFIYLKTRGFLEIDAKTNRVHSFVCVNTLVSEEEGKRLVQDMKRHYAVMIHHNEITAVNNSGTDGPPVENPQQVASAVMTLITNLPPLVSPSDLDYNPPSVESDYSMKSDSSTSRSAGTNSLAIIPPQANTIKSSVFKGMNIISAATKGKIKLQNQSTIILNKNNRLDIKQFASSSRPSVLQRRCHSEHLPQSSLTLCSETTIKYEPLSPASSESPLTRDLNYRLTDDSSEPSNSYTSCISQQITINSNGHSYQKYPQSTTSKEPTLKRMLPFEEDTSIEVKRRSLAQFDSVSLSPSRRVLEDPTTGKKLYLMIIKKINKAVIL